MRFRRRKSKSAGMDLSPLLDIVLQLLVFFMLTSTFAATQVPIDLGGAKTGQPAETQKVPSVTITSEGAVYLNGKPVSLESLTDRLKPLVAQSPGKAVRVRGDKASHLGLFLKVQDAAREAGAQHLGVDVKPEEAGGG